MAWVWRLLSATTLESWQEGKLQNSTLALVNITKKPKHVSLFSHYLLSRIKSCLPHYFKLNVLDVSIIIDTMRLHFTRIIEPTQCTEILLVPSVSVWQCVATRRSIIISERTPSLQGHHLFIFLFFSVINKNSQFVFILHHTTYWVATPAALWYDPGLLFIHPDSA